MRRTLDTMYRISGFLSAISMVAICAVVCIQVGFNIINAFSLRMFNVNPGLLLPSYTEFAGFFLVGTSFLGLAYALKADEHIRIVLVVQRLSSRHRAFAEVFSCLIALILCTFLGYNCTLLLVESLEYNDLSIGMIPVPLWIPQAFMVLGLYFLTIAFADRLFCTITTLGEKK